MSSAQARRVFALVGLMLLAGAALRLVLAGKWNTAPARTLSPAPARLSGDRVVLLGGLLVLCLAAAVLVPLALEARAASEHRQWAMAATGGDPAAAPKLMVRNGCAGCHTIPGVPGADARTGPRLDDLARQKFLAGVLPNTPQNLIGWIRDSRGLNPKTAMPSTFIDEQDARDIAAYLYTLRR